MDTIATSNKKEKRSVTYSSGDIYGRFTLTGKFCRNEKKERFLEAICTCGHIGFHRFKDVIQGTTKSCGCATREAIAKALTKHGCGRKNRRHPIYRAWGNMKDRCYREGYDGFHNYGGRGIKVCDEWVNDFNAFYNWAIENGWEKGLTLDRFPDVNGNYEPSNCRWATMAAQSVNRRNNFRVTAFGECKCLIEWEKDDRCSVKAAVIKRRIDKSWTAEDAITFPLEHETKPIFVLYKGESKTLGEWCNELNVDYTMVYKRIVYRKWSTAKAFETPNLKAQ